MDERYAIAKVKTETGHPTYELVEKDFSTKDAANEVRMKKYNSSNYIVVMYWD